VLSADEKVKLFVKCKGGDRRLEAGSFDALVLAGDFTTASERYMKFVESVRRNKVYGSAEMRIKTFRLECDEKRNYKTRLKGSDFALKSSESRALRAI
jgi:hypothetical protein